MPHVIWSRAFCGLYGSIKIKLAHIPCSVRSRKNCFDVNNVGPYVDKRGGGCYLLLALYVRASLQIYRGTLLWLSWLYKSCTGNGIWLVTVLLADWLAVLLADWLIGIYDFCNEWTTEVYTCEHWSSYRQRMTEWRLYLYWSLIVSCPVSVVYRILHGVAPTLVYCICCCCEVRPARSEGVWREKGGGLRRRTMCLATGLP